LLDVENATFLLNDVVLLRFSCYDYPTL